MSKGRRGSAPAARPRTLGDIVKSLPNVDLSGGPRPLAQQINILGFGEDRVVLRFDGARSLVWDLRPAALRRWRRQSASAAT